MRDDAQPAVPDASVIASDLGVVVGRLARRFRAENRLSSSHCSVLGRIEREGPQTASELALAEGVRHQSMAQTVKDLERQGFVARSPHPTDRRRVLVAQTELGMAALIAERRHREGWLARAIDEQLDKDQREMLIAALIVLRNLAAA